VLYSCYNNILTGLFCNRYPNIHKLQSTANQAAQICYYPVDFNANRFAIKYRFDYEVTCQLGLTYLTYYDTSMNRVCDI
jgi:hypothetical protein